MKKAIIVTIIILVVAAAVGVAFFAMRGGQGSGVPATGGVVGSLPTSAGGTTSVPSVGGSVPFLLGDGAVPAGEIVTAAPSNAPQGDSISFQSANGVVSLKNFYKAAQGYWPAFNALVLSASASHTVWYYRDSGEFSIVLPLGAPVAGEDAAAGLLAHILGIDMRELCLLPVNMLLMTDRGMDSQEYPLDFCQ